MRALDEAGVADSTLVVFTSDNGCSKAAGIGKLKEQGHLVSAHLRGSKADIWDGGHREPFVAHWPAAIPAGSVSTETVCLGDLLATAAALSGSPWPKESPMSTGRCWGPEVNSRWCVSNL